MTKRVSPGKPSQRKKSNYLYFSADDGTHGNELMSLKLTGKGNKVTLESDINDGPRSSLPRDLTIHDQRLFFTANERSKGRELWTVGPSIKAPLVKPEPTPIQLPLKTRRLSINSAASSRNQRPGRSAVVPTPHCSKSTRPTEGCPSDKLRTSNVLAIRTATTPMSFSCVR